MDYALVSPEGDILEFRSYGAPPEGTDVAAHKPRLLPLIGEAPSFDPAAEVISGPEFEVGEGEVTRVWTVRDKTSQELADDFEARKAAKRQAVRDRRAACEVGGFDGPGGARLRSDEKSQSKIAGLVTLFDKDAELTHVDFEAQPGVWVTVDQATADAIGVLLGRHLQACFSHSRVLDEALALAADDAALAAVDIEAGWPP